MPQFSRKRLLASATAIAVGVALLVFAFRVLDEANSESEAANAIRSWLAGGAIIGAGLLTPLRLTILGAVLGLAVQFAILFVVLHS
jgi:hypothetical protein